MKGGYKPGGGRPPGAKNVLPTKKQRKEQAAQVVVGPDPVELAKKFRETPLEYMLRVVNDQEADVMRRDRMAIAAAPFLHPKPAESGGGKKEQAEAAAKEAATGRFAPQPAPPAVDVRQLN